jgi:hypothetical protein
MPMGFKNIRYVHCMLGRGVYQDLEHQAGKLIEKSELGRHR